MRHGRSYWTISFLLFLPILANGATVSPAPHTPANSIDLKKTSIEISYNTQHKQADWVFYSLGANELRDCHSRQNNFRPDPELPSNVSSQLSDYSKSGYDRGHLSPAGDNKWSQGAMSDSFLLSNISPQPPRFNQGIWARLENLVRAWGKNMGGLWVATGPVLKQGLKSIGRNQISVPDSYYKVIVTQDYKHAIALELPTNASGHLSNFATSISQIEQGTRLDFFPGIPNERELENEMRLSDWDFFAKFQYFPCEKQNPGSISDWFEL